METMTTPEGKTKLDLIKMLYQNKGMLMSIAKHYGVFSEDECESVIQEVALNIWKAKNGYRYGSDPLPWIKTLVRNASIDWMRGRHGEKQLGHILENSGIVDSVTSKKDDPSKKKIEETRREFVDEMITSLDEPTQDVFKLRREGLPYKEVAKKLGIENNAAYKRFSRGAETLRRTHGHRKHELA